MALLFVDGFDYEAYNALLPGKWTAISLQKALAAGRHGGLAVPIYHKSSEYMYKDLGTNYATLIVGFAFLYTSLGTYVDKFLELMDAGTAHLYVALNSSRQLVLSRGDGTVLATGFSALAPDIWYYIEIKATINNSTGTCIIRANEVEQFSISGVDTQNTANAYINRVQISGIEDAQYVWFDDFVILDTTGPAPFDNFLGFIRVDTIRPTGAGSNAEWIPSAGSNYQCVDETVQNAGTDYVATSGEKIDTYAMANVPVDMTGSIIAVATNAVALKVGTAVTSVVPALLIGGNTYSGESFDASALVYTNYQAIKTVNPATGAAWTSGELNALEYGILKKV
jgi:hypothetical protein